MHDTAYSIGKLFLESYGAIPGGRLLEIGALDVNGSFRGAALPGTFYIGADMDPGRSVDVVIAPDGIMPFADNSMDAVLASSVFEHDPAFWLTFRQMCRIVKPGGYLYVSAPSNGAVHRYPYDCWRFYPDAGLALEAASHRAGPAVTLIESFIAERAGDTWNDFVAVFRREGRPVRYAERLHRQVACEHVYDIDIPRPVERTVQPDIPTEDMRLLAAARTAAQEQAEAIIGALFEKLLLREADAGERAAFGALLLQGGTMPQILQVIMTSPEFRGNVPAFLAGYAAE